MAIKLKTITTKIHACETFYRNKLFVQPKKTL